MSTYKRFEDLPVWQAAAALYERVDDLLVRASSRLRFSFRDQLERATLSVSNNIAEGFEGALDEHKHRNSVSGWKVAGLPWTQT